MSMMKRITSDMFPISDISQVNIICETQSCCYCAFMNLHIIGAR